MEIPLPLREIERYRDLTTEEHRGAVPRYVRLLLEDLAASEGIRRWFLTPDETLAVHERGSASTYFGNEDGEQTFWLLLPNSPLWQEINREGVSLYKVHGWPDPVWQTEVQELWCVSRVEVSQEATTVLSASVIYLVSRFALVAGMQS